MGQAPTKQHHSVGKPLGGNHSIGQPRLRRIQQEVKQASARAGRKEATGVEKFFGAPGRNQAEIKRIIDKWRGDIVKEVNFTLRRMPKMNIDGIIVPNMAGILAETKRETYLKDWYGRDILQKVKELNSELSQIVRSNRRGQIKSAPAFQQWKVKADIIFTQLKKRLAEILVMKTPSARSLYDELTKEENKYQERLAGFRAGWVIGTAFVAVKQGVERILNSPVLRKAYLETFAIPIGLIPVIGPLLARVMRAAAVDMNFDIGDFLRELFAEGVGKVMELMAMSAIGMALPPGLSPTLLKVAKMGGGLVAKSVGASGATSIVQNVSKEKRRLDREAEKTVKKVAG